MSEIFDVVDENNRVIGTARRSDVHGNPALIHRVAHVLVLNSGGLLFLQKRARSKIVQPNRWDTSVGGHVDSGETYEEAAWREMSEELGIAPERLEPLYTYLHRNSFESEMVTTFRTTWDGVLRVNPDEISEGRFWSVPEINGSDPELFTPNFLEELARFIKHCRA